MDRDVLCVDDAANQRSETRRRLLIRQQVELTFLDTANPVRQPPLRSFGPSPTPILRGKAMGTGALTNLAQPDAAAKSP